MKQKKTEFQKMLDKKIEESRIEKAKKEAEQINNYNRWKSEHDRLVKKELRKLERKNRPKIHRETDKTSVILKIAFIILILLEIINNYPEIESWLLNLLQ